MVIYPLLVSGEEIVVPETEIVEEVSTSTESVVNIVKDISAEISTSSSEVVPETIVVTEQVIESPIAEDENTPTIEGVHTEIIQNDMSQRAFRLTARTVKNIDTQELQEGAISWSFIPESIDIQDTTALYQYALDHYFGFTNDPSNILIDDNNIIPNERVRIIIFDWNCSSQSCDSINDIQSVIFLSDDVVNYRRSAMDTDMLLTHVEL